MWLYTFLSNGLNSKLKDKMKDFKGQLQNEKVKTAAANQKIDQISYKLSTDFRNSLTEIDNKLQNIVDLSSKEELQESLVSSRQETYRLASYIDDFTDSRQSLFRPKLSEAIDVTELFTNEISKFSEELEQKSVQVDFSPYTGEVFLIDKSLLALVFRNILANAIDFLDSEQKTKSITIKSFSSNQVFHLSISDNGIGIPRNEIREVFNLYYSTKRGEGNHGLGLYEVKEAVNLLNGELTIESDNEKGTTVTVAVPFTSLH